MVITMKISHKSTILPALISTVLVLTISACSNSNAGPSDERFGLEEVPISAKVTVDEVTGVYWVIFQNGYGSLDAEPILLPDGTPARVDNVDYPDVAADIAANQVREGGK